MRISVGTSSQNLTQLLTKEQQRKIIELKDDKKFSLAFVVVGAGNVYVETLGIEATTTDGMPVNGNVVSMSDSQLAEISLISDTPATDVRILAA